MVLTLGHCEIWVTSFQYLEVCVRVFLITGSGKLIFIYNFLLTCLLLEHLMQPQLNVFINNGN